MFLEQKYDRLWDSHNHKSCHGNQVLYQSAPQEYVSVIWDKLEDEGADNQNHAFDKEKVPTDLGDSSRQKLHHVSVGDHVFQRHRITKDKECHIVNEGRWEEEEDNEADRLLDNDNNHKELPSISVC